MISMSKKPVGQKGFTLVELMIVIVVIVILAGIAYVANSVVQERAREARIKSDYSTLREAVEIARNKRQQALAAITGSYWTGQYCLFQPPGAPSPGAAIPANTDFSVQNAMTQGCWTAYTAALQAITDASGVDITDLRDPWGRPYYIDENEQPSGGGQCSADAMGWLSRPYVGGYNQNWSTEMNIPPYKTLCYT